MNKNREGIFCHNAVRHSYCSEVLSDLPGAEEWSASNSAEFSCGDKAQSLRLEAGVIDTDIRQHCAG